MFPNRGRPLLWLSLHVYCKQRQIRGAILWVKYEISEKSEHLLLEYYEMNMSHLEIIVMSLITPDESDESN